MGQGRSRFGGHNDACYICLEDRSPLLRTGCACRDLHAHVVCIMQYKTQRLRHNTPLSVMWTCDTCMQEYSGTFRGVLAQTWHGTVQCDSIFSVPRAMATMYLADCYDLNGVPQEALDMLDRYSSALAKGGVTTFDSAMCIARGAPMVHLGMFDAHFKQVTALLVKSGLSDDNYLMVEAKTQRALNLVTRPEPRKEAWLVMAKNDITDVLAIQRAKDAAGGDPSASTIASTQNLAHVMSVTPGGVPEAVRILDELMPVVRRVLGREHEITLNAESNLSIYIGRGAIKPRYSEARELGRHVYATRSAALGPTHPNVNAARIALHGTLQRTHMLCSRPECATLADAVETCRRCETKYCTDACRQAHAADHARVCPSALSRRARGGR
jgi:hypothetical protein